MVRLFIIEQDLTEKRRRQNEEIAKIQDSAAEPVVQGETVESAAKKVIEAQEQVRITEQAIILARQRRVDAITKRNKSEGATLRAAAKTKRDEASDIQRKEEPLFRKLSDLEGITFDNSILLFQHRGTGLLVPRSRILAEEAGRLDDQAAELEGREVPSSDRLTLTKPPLAEMLATQECAVSWNCSPKLTAPPTSGFNTDDSEAFF